MIMLVLILLFGAKDAPRILRGIQEVLDKLQRSAASFRYKLLYGDLSAPHEDKTYDVDADYPKEDENTPSDEEKASLLPSEDEEKPPS